MAKTEFMLVTARQRLPLIAKQEIKVQIDNPPIERVKSTKALGVTLQDNRSWANHVDRHVDQFLTDQYIIF